MRGSLGAIWVLSDKAKRETERLHAQIGRADFLIIAVKAGSPAEGFVLGMETIGGLRSGDAERLYIAFKPPWKNGSRR